MALVSYDVSDASDIEEEEETVNVPEVIKPTDPSTSSTTIEEDGSELFAVLPKPKAKPLVLESDLKRLLMNPTSSSIDKKKSIKISVPALTELEEDDLPRPTTKKINPSKGCKLFDILPPPKNTAGGVAAAKKLVPDSLRKPVPKPVLKAAPKPIVPKLPVLPTAAPVLEEESDSDDDGNDFLGLVRKELPTVSPVEIPLPEVPELPTEEQEIPAYNEEPVMADSSTGFEPLADDNLGLDEEALQKLCGGNKRKRTAQAAQLIDVSDTDIMPDKNEWLLKQLTEEKVKRQSHKKHAGPSSQQRRKHQITYLAFQAKEQEQELQNQWANNKMTKKQTQSKYGF